MLKSVATISESCEGRDKEGSVSLCLRTGGEVDEGVKNVPLVRRSSISFSALIDRSGGQLIAMSLSRRTSRVEADV